MKPMERTTLGKSLSCAMREILSRDLGDGQRGKLDLDRMSNVKSQTSKVAGAMPTRAEVDVACGCASFGSGGHFGARRAQRRSACPRPPAAPLEESGRFFGGRGHGTRTRAGLALFYEHRLRRVGGV